MWDGIFTNKPENPIFKEIGLSLAKNLLELKLNPMSVASNLSYKCVTGKTIVNDLLCKAHKSSLNWRKGVGERRKKLPVIFVTYKSNGSPKTEGLT